VPLRAPRKPGTSTPRPATSGRDQQEPSDGCVCLSARPWQMPSYPAARLKPGSLRSAFPLRDPPPYRGASHPPHRGLFDGHPYHRRRKSSRASPSGPTDTPALFSAPSFNPAVDPSAEPKMLTVSGESSEFGQTIRTRSKFKAAGRPTPLSSCGRPGNRRDAGQTSSARVPSHTSRTISAAGLAWAMAADWPAQTCMRCASPAFCPAARSGAVSARCTG
jgi:hypothetical protein